MHQSHVCEHDKRVLKRKQAERPVSMFLTKIQYYYLAKTQKGKIISVFFLVLKISKNLDSVSEINTYIQ